jgi:hypothetical protein
MRAAEGEEDRLRHRRLSAARRAAMVTEAKPGPRRIENREYDEQKMNNILFSVVNQRYVSSCINGTKRVQKPWDIAMSSLH